MGKHALERPRRRPRGGARRASRATAPTRRGRAAALVAALTVTSVSVASGWGMFPTGTPAVDSADAAASTDEAETRTRTLARSPITDAGGPIAVTTGSTSLPPDSGEGRRVVFSESAQRVWLVDAGERERVLRTYLASGSVFDNLEPGTYEVFSRSRHAVGIDDSGTMEYFVRFTYGDNGAAIGFHTIPVADGRRVQTTAELGTPLSHGCIRQRRADAIALWDFAPLGTPVVVTA